MVKKESIIFHKCDFVGCEEAGEYKAPKDNSLQDYYWFCLKHVRSYNKNWNYYKDYSPDEMEQAIRDDVIWQRKTKLFGSRGDSKQQYHLPQKIVYALNLFELSFPYTHKEVKAKYKELAKKYHPDTNHGNKELEEKFKKLTQNYKVLLEFIY